MSTHTIYPDVPLYDSDGEGDTQFLWDYPFDARTPKNTIFSIDTGEFASGWIGASLDVSGQDRLNQLDSQVLPQLEQDTYCLPTPMVTRSPSRDQETTIGPSPSNSNQYISEISGPCSLSSDTILSDTLSCSPSSDITSYNTTPPTNSNATLQIVQYSPTRTRKKSKPNRSRITKPQIRREGPCALTARLDVLKLDTSPKTSVKRDENGKVAGTVAVFGLNQVVRAPIDNELRLATTITRRVGACSRCRRHRLRCDVSENMYEPCGQCLRRQTTLLKYQPCMRVSVLDLQLHRKGPTISNDLDSWVQRKQQQLLGYGSYAATHVIFLTQGFGEAKENALSVKVSLFEPGEGDRTDYFWTDPYGQPRRMRMPPYFISDMEAASQSIRELLHSARSVYIETLLSDANPLVRETIQAALIHNTFGQSTLISDALELWVAARFIENQWRVFCGGVMIGLNPVNEPGNPWNGVTPITPIMDTQLDYLVIRDLLVPLSHQFLEKLKAKIDAMRRENWLEIYFAIFIVMSNFGLVIKDLIANATWKGLKPGSRGGTLTQGYMHACKTLLAYFHHACSGSVPLSLNFEALGDNENGDSGMTPDQIKYIQGIQEEMDRQKSTISNWKHISMYNDENYWCYQMLCQDWRGDIPHAGDIDDFREEDLLSSSGT